MNDNSDIALRCDGFENGALVNAKILSSFSLTKALSVIFKFYALFHTTSYEYEIDYHRRR